MNNLLIELYVRLLNEYFSIMEQSIIFKSIENKKYILYIGLNAINNIFKMNLITSKNIQTTYHYCEKACYCYLEYIEQINKTEVLNNLNITDVITFVYKVNILYNDDKPPISVENNIHPPINTDNLKNLFILLTRVSTILFNWNNENMDENIQIIICQKYLLKYLYFLNESKFPEYIDYIETITEKIKMNKDVYIDFLEQFYKKMKNNKNDIRTKIMGFINDYNNNNIIINDMKQFIKTYG
jgi:hypothetical protein